MFILFYSIVTDASTIKAEFKSDMNTDTSNFPNSYMFEKYGNEILDLQVGETDMKVRHIFKKFGEVCTLVKIKTVWYVLYCMCQHALSLIVCCLQAANNYMEKYGADLPYFQNFRIPDMPEISLPETLFINT